MTLTAPGLGARFPLESSPTVPAWDLGLNVHQQVANWVAELQGSLSFLWHCPMLTGYKWV